MKKLLSILSISACISTSAQTAVWGVGSSVGVADAEFANPFVNAVAFTAGTNPSAWTSLSISQSGGAVTPGAAYWKRTLLGRSQGGYWGGTTPIPSPSQPNGMAIFDSDYLDNNGSQGAFGTGTSPSPHHGELISPRFDLTGYSDQNLVVSFFSFYREFQITSLAISLSTNDGATWSTPVDHRTYLASMTQGTANVPVNDVLDGITNLTQCRLKFIFNGDYYFAMVDDVTISVVCTPPIITVNSGTICAGQSFTINPSGASTYTISDGNSVVSPTVTSTYTVTGTSADGCVSTAAAIATVVVNASPTISVNSGTICSGQSFTLSPSGADTYTISGGNSIVSPTADATYSVTGTDANGCVSASAAIASVTVNALPSISVNSGAICSGQSFTLSPGGADTYTISGGNSIVSPTTDATYSVTGTDANGCVSASAAIASVTVNALPSISVNSGAICSGQSFTLSPSGADTYTISGGNSIVSPTTDATYSVTGTDANGCVSASAAIASVTVNALPSISVNSGAICSGQSYTLSPGGADTYTISGGNSIVSPTTDATYSVTGTDANGCVSASAAIASVTVNALPNVTAVTNSTLLCVGQTATLTASGADTYTWSSSENTISIAVSPTVTTSYTITGTDANGCVNTSTVSQVVDLCTGISSFIGNQSSSIAVYPNPTNGLLYIEIPKNLFGQTLILTNTMGQVLETKIIDNTIVDYNLETIPNGIYFIQVQTQNGLISKKIIKN